MADQKQIDWEDRFREAQTKQIERLTQQVQELVIEVAVVKTKAGAWGAIFGSIFAVIVAIITKLLIK